jgi:hypothetical protein
MKRNTSWQNRVLTSQTNVFKGSIEGRIKSAIPVRRQTATDPGYEDEQDESDVEYVLFMQEVFPITASGLQTLKLHYLPQENSEHVYWHPAGLSGIYQEQVQWQRTDNVIKFNDQDNLLQVGDLLIVEYAYLESDEVDDTAVAAPTSVTGADANAYIYMNIEAVSALSPDAIAYVYMDVTASLPDPVPDADAYIYMNVQ